MIFNEVWGIKHINDGTKVVVRSAVRAIIFDDDKLLLIKTKLGDYKLPGGGIKVYENYEEALIREVKEETGYTINKVYEKSGVVVERNPDRYEENAVFEMTSSYYLCEISTDKKGQQLDDYERELDFRPVWVSFEDAIYHNEVVLTGSKDNINDWVLRETKILKTLKKWRKTF